MDVDFPGSIRSELTRRWNEPHRHHHDQSHLEELLAALQVLHGDGLKFDVRPVVLAAWFHDAIYDPTSPRNEEASADLAREMLADDPDRDEVARLVELTKEHRPDAGDANGIALSDADFAVLGAAPDRYDEYGANVRREYHRVPGPLFASTRAELLAEFLTREHLFASASARERWEAPARANLAREIDVLRG